MTQTQKNLLKLSLAQAGLPPPFDDVIIGKLDDVDTLLSTMIEREQSEILRNYVNTYVAAREDETLSTRAEKLRPLIEAMIDSIVAEDPDEGTEEGDGTPH